MGLIDADTLKEYCMCASKSDDDFRRVSLATLASVIYAQPIAYDPDEVVEQLEKWTFNADVNIGDGTMMNHNLIVSKNAIEIVKGGGVDG